MKRFHVHVSVSDLAASIRGETAAGPACCAPKAGAKDAAKSCC